MYLLLRGVLDCPAILQCREAWPHHYIKVNAFNPERGVESRVLSFIANRPEHEPGFRLERQETEGRQIRHTFPATPPADRFGE